MNRNQVIAAALFAFIGSSAFAVEAEQMVAPQGQLTRAEVQAELGRARASGELGNANESYAGVTERSFATRGGAIERTAVRSREDVRDEARAAARQNRINVDYAGG